MRLVKTIEFDYDYKNCEDVWAAPLWITPQTWKFPAATSGEVDFLEMCPVGQAWTNFASPGYNLGSGSSSGGPKHFIMYLDSKTGTLTTKICDLDQSNCFWGASYGNFLNVVTSTEA